MTANKGPNILYIMTDQQRFDTIAALGNSDIHTPNLDRLVKRGITFSNAYATCPVCMPSRYTIRTGCEPFNTRVFTNKIADPVGNQPDTIEGRCGQYLPRKLTNLGYRTFGVGKFHSVPWNEDLGYELQLRSEELYDSKQTRPLDDFVKWLTETHPQFNFLEDIHGERTEMYYVPQRSATPAHATVEGWAAKMAVEQIQKIDDRPYFGFVSFIGPHPPFAPPIPFNRLYDPDKMPNPIVGEITHDHLDEQIPWMNHIIWAEDINEPLARILKARYYGEITYIDHCIGQILDTVQASPDPDNTLICFFSDHGDHMGDHHAWQKESFFESACKIPFLLSWPAQLEQNKQNDALVCLTDLFAIAANVADSPETRDGIDILEMLRGNNSGREFLTGCHGVPGTINFKIMIRKDNWKYIYFANGGRKQLFNLTDDPHELKNLIDTKPDIADQLHLLAQNQCKTNNANDALDDSGLKAFDFQKLSRGRIKQGDVKRPCRGFAENIPQTINQWEQDSQT